MSTIHQIYCTHCTHGTSALSAAEGELADRMLGYSARAGSLESHALRRYYRQIERYVYYYLPRDTPGEEKLRLTASTAPRRLVYHPSVGGLQVLAQVGYRQTDTEGRPGSYFAHVLFREENDGSPPWSPLDCLRLWAAPGWVDEDSPYHPFLLEPLSSLDAMLGGRRPAVDDRVLLSFLSTPPGGAFDDPAGAIPERWRRMDLKERRNLFLGACGGFLHVGGTRPGSLLLVIEPSVAALVFYGVVRLLPAGDLRGRLSFSTFEPNADRVGASLAATAFHDPQKSDLRADAYRSRGFACNTFVGRRSESPPAPTRYAAAMVRRLLEGGWPAVDASLANLASAGARTYHDLAALAAVQSLVPALLNPSATPPAEDWRASRMATDYLRRSLMETLHGLSDPAASLHAIIGRPAHLTILELLAGEPSHDARTRAVVGFLLDHFPGAQIAELVRRETVSSEAKVEVLARHVAAHHQLPPGCEHVWSEAASPPVPPPRLNREVDPRPNEPARTAAPPAPSADALLARVLARLDPNTLEAFYRRVAAQHSDAFLMAFLAAWQRGRSSPESLARVVRAADDVALLSLLRNRGPAFFQQYPDEEPALGAKLHAMVGSLPQYPGQFPERLDVLLAGRHLLPDEDQHMVTAWSNCRRAILDVGRLQEEQSGVLRHRPLDELETQVRRMAQEARKAMPLERFDDDPNGSRKQTCLGQIGQRLLDGRPLLPSDVWQHEALWQKIAWYFEGRAWPTAPLKRLRPAARTLGLGWILMCVLVAAAAGLVAVGALSVMNRGRGGDTDVMAASLTEEVGSDTSEATAEAQDVDEPPSSQVPTVEPEPTTDDQADEDRIEPAEAPLPAEAPPAEAPSADDPWTESPQPGVNPKPGASMPQPAEPEPQAVAEPAQDGTAPPRDAWKVRAEAFAERHAGRFFDEAPLAQGTLPIPADELPPARDGEALYLGGGVLYFDNAVFPFGHRFENGPPVVRHEVPELANALGVPSVYVELQPRPDGAAVVLDHVAQTMPPDAESRTEELVDQVERNARMMMSQLRAHAARSATEEDRDAAFDKLVELTEIEIPVVPTKPSRRSEQFRDDPDGYEAALRAYDEAVAARRKAKESVIPTAKHAVATVDQRKKFIEDEFLRYREQLREQNEKASAALAGQARRISVIVYRAAEGVASAGTAPAPTAPAEAVDSVEGRFVIEERPAQGLNPPSIARLRPLVTAEEGRPLPPWYHGQIATSCRIVEENADGLLLRTKRLGDVFTEKSAEVFTGATAVRVRFEFSARSDTPLEQPEKAPLAAAAHRIERIERGKQYAVTLQLTDEALDWLRLLAGGPEPPPSDPNTKP